MYAKRRWKKRKPIFRIGCQIVLSQNATQPTEKAYYSSQYRKKNPSYKYKIFSFWQRYVQRKDQIEFITTDIKSTADIFLTKIERKKTQLASLVNLGAKMSFSECVEIDGKYLEGGGQILRNALSFSCILRRRVRIVDIRANRPNPGLSNQHLFGLNLLAKITNAKVTGNEIKSTIVEFNPGEIRGGKYFVDTLTAASITLVLQCALPVLLFSGTISELELVGGTNVGMAPQVDFMTEVLRPNLEKFGVSFDFDLIQRGYYPRGGGRCKVFIPHIQSIDCVNIINFGELQEIVGWCYVAGRLPNHLADDIKKSAEKELQTIRCHKTHIEAYKESGEVARDNGSGCILTAITTTDCVIGSDRLGGKQIDASELGSTAAKQLKNLITHKICVDDHVQDQLIIYMALAKETSVIVTSPPTNHTLTAIYVAEKMTTARFKIENLDEHMVRISCTGIAYMNDK